ncbi:MAG: hypothetical protein HYU02_03935 [Thaumarchaeota archaeon]|nr:hypothetical protein [Nitrososphaerota archaeon]
MKPVNVDIEIEVTAYLNPSEGLEKVASAIKNIIPSSNPRRREDSVIAEVSSIGDLQKIYEQTRSRQTLGVVRNRLLRNLSSDETFVFLNRQAAFAGAIVTCDDDNESPLGAIKLTLRSSKIMEVIDWIAPRLDRER